jgi:hypothetical protein
VITFDLFDTLYWATGQSTTGMKDGKFNELITDQYPTIWKIPLNTENKNVLLAYIESVFQNCKKSECKTAGQIYTDMHDKNIILSGINRIFHPFPCNKFYLWFPGVKSNNACSNGYLQGRNAITYLPDIKYNIVSNPSDSDSLNAGLMEKQKSKKYQTQYIILFVVLVILVLLITLGVFYYIKNKNVL